MKKQGMEKERNILRLLPVLLALFLALGGARTAFAVCETPAEAIPDVLNLETQDQMNFQKFIQQEASFDWEIYSTAYELLAKAWTQFDQNVLQALNAFSDQIDSATPAGLKYMAKELHVSQVDQTHLLGLLIDSQRMIEEKMRVNNHDNNAQTRYMPSFLACDIDTTGPGLNRAYQISRALNRTLALDDEPRRENAMGNWPALNASGQWTAQPTSSANGTGADVYAAWQTYVSKYCDNTMGDQGCTAPGADVGHAPLNAGPHKDIGAFLWGPQQTIDPTNPENIREIQDTLRYIVDPLAPDAIPATVVPMPGDKTQKAQAPQGRYGILERHAEDAYVNTIYNVLGAMLSERIGGSRVDVSEMRALAGIPQSDTQPGTLPDVGASYRDIQEAMTRDRFDDPQYLVKMLGNPEQVLRERNTLSALRLQTMNDIYRRQEELLFMEAAEYGRDLNNQIPRPEAAKRLLRQ